MSSFGENHYPAERQSQIHRSNYLGTNQPTSRSLKKTRLTILMKTEYIFIENTKVARFLICIYYETKFSVTQSFLRQNLMSCWDH